MSDYWPFGFAGLTFVALLGMGNHLGIWSSGLARWIGLLLFSLWFGALYPRTAFPLSNKLRHRLAGFVLFIVGVALYLGVPMSVALGVLPLTLGSVLLILPVRSEDLELLRNLFYTIALTVLLGLAATTFPRGHLWADVAVESLTRGIARIVGHQWAVRSSVCSAVMLIFCLIWIGVSAGRSRRFRFESLTVVCLLLVAGVVAYLFLLHGMNRLYAQLSDFRPFMDSISRPGCGVQHESEPIRWSHFIRYMCPGSAQVVLVALLLPAVIATAALFPPASPTTIPMNHKRSRDIVAGLVGVLIATLATLPTPEAGKAPGRILFLTRDLLTDRPDYTKFGEKAGGMFGWLADFLRAAGYNVITADAITEGKLKDQDLLIVANPQKRFPDEEETLIREFLARGGSLIGLGDHTGLTAIRDPLNQLFSPYGLAINFDSSMYRRRGYLGEVQEFPYDLDLAGIELLNTMHTTQHLIGATLSLDPWSGALPFLLSRCGYADIGDRGNAANGHLGNFRYDENETLGDIVLVGRRTLPSGGRLMLFGDTTAFQNTPLALSYPFVLRCIAWTLRKPSEVWTILRIAALAAVLAVTVVLIWRRRGVPSGGLLSGALVGLLISSAVTSYAARTRQPAFSLPVVWIDAGHMERFVAQLWHPQGVEALVTNVLRANALPAVSRHVEPESLPPKDALVLVAPATPYSKTEVENTVNFVRRGGLLILTVGFEECDGSKPLLDRFGLTVEPVPLGAVERKDPPNPVALRNAWRVSSLSKETRVLREYLDSPVIVELPYGRGDVILIADTDFLIERLEEREVYFPMNVDLFRQLLTEHFAKCERATEPR